MDYGIFYWRSEKPEYFDKGNVIFHKLSNEDERAVFEIPREDNPKNVNCVIYQLIEIGEFRIFVLSWPIYKNVFCLRKDTDELVWRLPEPKNIWKERRNYWTEVRPSQTQPDKNIYVYSCDKYNVEYEVSTMKIIQEYFPTNYDPRDF